MKRRSQKTLLQLIQSFHYIINFSFDLTVNKYIEIAYIELSKLLSFHCRFLIVCNEDNYMILLNMYGGEGGIRTHGTLTRRTADFESAPLQPLRYLSLIEKILLVLPRSFPSKHRP